MEMNNEYRKPKNEEYKTNMQNEINGLTNLFAEFTGWFAS